MTNPIYGIPPDHKVHTDLVAIQGARPWTNPEELMDQLKTAGITGKGCICINLDTGYRKHNSLPEPLAVKNFTGASQSVIDNHGHGTHTIGSNVGRNGYSAAPEADIKVGKVLSDSGSGSNTVAGLLWAAEQDGDVVSCSWGGGSSVDSSTQNALKEIEDSGKWTFFAAGNAGYNGSGSTVIAPGLSPNTVCVASHNQDMSPSGFSSGGPRVDLIAGGGLILSTGISGPESTAIMSGTSMATPTAASAALVLRQVMKMLGMKTALTSRGLVAFLKSEEFLKDAGPIGRDNRFGEGIVITNQNIIAWCLKKMSPLLAAIFICMLLSMYATAQNIPTVEVPQVQVTFQRAKSAKVVQEVDSVLIFAMGLSPLIEYAVELTVDTSVEWVEIHDDLKPFPPITQKPIDSKVLVIGKPAQLFWVSLRNSTGPPAWVKVIVAPKVITPPPPVKDFAKITELSKAKAALLDKPTAANIKKALTSKLDSLTERCKDGQCPTLAATKQELLEAVNDAPKDGKYEWYAGWRIPIVQAISSLALTTTPEYIAAMQAAAEGL